MSRRSSKASAASVPPEWYVLRPLSLALAVVYLLILLVRPMLTEAEGHAGTIYVITIVLAMLAAWIGWRVFRHSDRFANAGFCTVLVLSAVWTLVLPSRQRDATVEAMRRTFDTHITAVERVPRDVLAAK